MLDNKYLSPLILFDFDIRYENNIFWTNRWINISDIFHINMHTHIFLSTHIYEMVFWERESSK